MADKIIARKEALWKSVDRMHDLSLAFLEQVKLEVLQKDDLKNGDILERCHRMAGGLSGVPLQRALDGGSNEEVFGALHKICSHYIQFNDDILSDIAEDVSPAEGELVVTYSFRMFLERTGLQPLDPQRFTALHDKVLQEVDKTQDNFSNVDDKTPVDEQGAKILSAEYLAALRDFKVATAMKQLLARMAPVQE